MMPATYTPGRGDAITWGRCTGHPHDPRTAEPPEDYISPEDAPTIAADLIRSTPAAWAAWLQVECAADTGPLCYVTLTRALRTGSRRLSVPELLALVACGYDADLPQVRYQLAEAFNSAHREQAEEDAAAMLAEQARQEREAAEVEPELWA
jgi:hypothetical protein